MLDRSKFQVRICEELAPLMKWLEANGHDVVERTEGTWTRHLHCTGPVDYALLRRQFRVPGPLAKHYSQFGSTSGLVCHKHHQMLTWDVKEEPPEPCREIAPVRDHLLAQGNEASLPVVWSGQALTTWRFKAPADLTSLQVDGLRVYQTREDRGEPILWIECHAHRHVLICPLPTGGAPCETKGKGI